MIFKVVFSGPCAYVPNRIASDPKPAASWSAILPQASLGLAAGEVVLAPHYAVLQFATDLFDVVDGHMDLRFRHDGGGEFGLIQLSGHQIRIKTGGAKPPFNPMVVKLDQQTLESGQPSTDEQKDSLDWLPSLEGLLPGSGAFGNPDDSFFQGSFPDPGTIAAHVILDQGDLVTYSLVPDLAGPTETPSIWGFRAFPGKPFVAKQAVAHAVALRIDPLTRPLEIHLITAKGVRILRLKETAPDGEVIVEIKNREMDEIIQFAQSQILEGAVDTDFKAVFTFSGTQKESCPLPTLAKAGGVGCLRNTCGGGSLDGFAPSLAAALAGFSGDVGGGKP